jgi:two-component system OmpR family sensor kinase
MALTVAGLITAVSLLLAALSTLAVRSFLEARVDHDLAAAVSRTSGFVGSPGGAGGGGPGPDHPEEHLFGLGQGAGTLAGIIRGNRAQAQILSDGPRSQPKTLDEDETRLLRAVPADGDPATVDFGDEGRYRVAAVTMRDGDVLLTGLPLAGIDATLGRLLSFEAVVAALAVLLASLAGSVLVRRNLRPLDRLAVTASRVAGLPLSSGEVDLADRVSQADSDPRTEVGQLGSAFNAMLDNVGSALAARQRSESRIRQFVADASHELRTPLTAIRGYAELNRRAMSELPTDLAYAAQRIDCEAVRMSELVDDLLLLARLDSGRPLVHAEVDLTRSVIDAVNDARVAGPDHRWQLDLPDSPVIVSGDSGRLHQVIANLLTNARVHTPAATTVTTQIQRRGGAAVFHVSDNGPGVDAELQPQVFERFTRADSSRSRAAGSTGLGLSIVQAVVTAHGGEVRVTSQPGNTTFEITLPLAPGAASAEEEPTPDPVAVPSVSDSTA